MTFTRSVPDPRWSRNRICLTVRPGSFGAVGGEIALSPFVFPGPPESGHRAEPPRAFRCAALGRASRGGPARCAGCARTEASGGRGGGDAACRCGKAPRAAGPGDPTAARLQAGRARGADRPSARAAASDRPSVRAAASGERGLSSSLRRCGRAGPGDQRSAARGADPPRRPRTARVAPARVRLRAARRGRGRPGGGAGQLPRATGCPAIAALRAGTVSGLASRMERCSRRSVADGSRPSSRTSVVRSRW